MTVFPPSNTPPPTGDPEELLADLEAKLPGLAAHHEPDNPGMHTTATVDLEIVLHGELVLELDNGQTRTIRAGDAIVQNGTRHRWLNHTTDPAVVAAVLIGVPHERLN